MSGGWLVAAALLAAGPLAGQQAPLEGTWDITFGVPLGGRQWTLVLDGSGQQLAGSLDMGPLGANPIRQILLSGRRLRMNLPLQLHGFSGTLEFTGRVEDGLYRGELKGFPGTTRPVSFRARRRPGAASQRASPAHTIPLRPENGWFIVPVVVTGDTLDFIFDTGAGMSTVTESSAARLGLDAGSSVTAQGASGAQQVRLTSLPSLQFGGVVARNLRVLVLEDRVLAPVTDEGVRGLPYDGVLGVDVFGRFDLHVDPLEGVVHLFDPGRTPGAATLSRLGEPIPIQRFSGGLIAQDVVANGITVSAVVDTGSRHVILNKLAAEAAAVASAAIPAQRMGVGNEDTEVAEGSLESLQVGNTRMGTLPVRVADLPIFAATGFGDEPVVLLGNPVFRRCPVFISYRDGSIRYCREPSTGGW